MYISSKYLFEQALAKLQEAKLDKEEARQSLYWLMKHFFGLEKTAIHRDKEMLYDDTRSAFEQAIARLQTQEPIQYILGEAYFMGRRFGVNADVLIPRPETEELVAHILQNIQSSESLKVLDIGTGSGCIAISLALQRPQDLVFAMDISAAALAVAAQNAQDHGVVLPFIQQDVLSLERLWDDDFDLIVSNPPYITESEKADMKNNVLQYEPAGALFVEDVQPLLFYEKIADLAKAHLKAGGKLYFEINERFGQEVEALLTQKGFKEIKILQDMQQKPRIALASR